VNEHGYSYISYTTYTYTFQRPPGTGTLKISYTWSCQGLLPDLHYLLLYLTENTVLQELEGSLNYQYIIGISTHLC